ncbi:MAG: choice-of-anchor Q domain-containing protein [Planctomycetota bacterium]
MSLLRPWRRDPFLAKAESRLRRLRFEPLEERRVLTVLTVDTPFDVIDANDGRTSLREAINTANLMPGPDEIVFDVFESGFQGASISLGEFLITDGLTITGPGADSFVINAWGRSRIFNIDDPTTEDEDFDVTLSGMTLTEGSVSGAHISPLDTTYSGGAIRSATTGVLTLVDSVVSYSRTRTHYSGGGGVFVRGDLVLTGSSVAHNYSSLFHSGFGARGGGVFAGGSVTLSESEILRNRTYGPGASGGGVFAARDVTITNSTITGNSTWDSLADGGGFRTNGFASITNSTIEYNSAGDFFQDSDGGGFRSRGALLVNSTVRHNFAERSGGGFFSDGPATLIDSVIDGNFSYSGGGGFVSTQETMLTNSIVRKNLTRGTDANGGGFTSRSATLINSEISGNHTTGGFSEGGGFSASEQVDLVDSLVIQNWTEGSNSDGGGFYSWGTVLLEGSTIEGNSTQGTDSSGGGFFAVRDTTLINSVVSGNTTAMAGSDSGGFRSLAGVALTYSTVSDNATQGDDAGGGGFTAVEATIVRSTISANSTEGLASSGGGFSAESATLTGSTVSGNSTAGESAHGAGGYARDIELFGSTITENHATGHEAFGGGLFVTSGVGSLDHAIVYGNGSGGVANDIAAATGSYVVDNLLIGAIAGGTQALLSNTILGTDPLLGLLQDNGGPTFTHALLEGSPAIDAGDPGLAAGLAGVPEFDQRGFAFTRVFGGAIDLGAVERQEFFPLSLMVDTIEDESDGDYSRFDLSLREAIELTNFYPAADGITFDTEVFGTPQVIVLEQGELGITDGLTVSGPGAELLTIDAQQRSRIFNIDDPSEEEEGFDVAFSGLTLTGGRAEDSGGAVRSVTFGELSILNSVVTGNRSEGGVGGGGVYARPGGEPERRPRGLGLITAASDASNTTIGDGLGLSDSATTTIENSLLLDNSTDGSGGGLWAAGRLQLIDSEVIDNRAVVGGGGVYTYSYSEGEIRDSLISGNSVEYEGDVTYYSFRTGGGGVLSLGGFEAPLTIIDSEISSNWTDREDAEGGGVKAGDLVLTRSLVSGNSTRAISSSGGGVYVASGLSAVDSLLTGNTTYGTESAGGGVGLYLSRGGTIATEFIRTTVSGNRTYGDGSFGGGVGMRWGSSSPPEIIDSTIEDNHALAASGGGLGFSSSIAPVIQGARIRNNTAASDGGGLFWLGARADAMAVEDSVISGNTAGGLGGGVFVTQGDASMTRTTVSGNLAAEGGGGVSSGENSEETWTIVDSLVEANEAEGPGGGISVFNAVLSRTRVVGNSTAESYSYGSFSYGGGIHARGDVTVTESTVESNSTSGRRSGGGGIYADGSVTVSRSSISQNSAPGLDSWGGGLRAGADVAIEESFVEGNISGGSGGGVIGRVVTVSDSSVSGNVSSRSGGGISSYSTILTRSVVSGNSTGSRGGGGVTVSSKGYASLIESSVVGNTTSGNGGGIRSFVSYGLSGDVTLHRSTVSGNNSGRDGGGVYAQVVSSTQSTVSGNQGRSKGGGIFATQGGFVSLANSTVSGNSLTGSNSRGAGVYAGLVTDVRLDNSTITGNTATSAGSAGSGVVVYGGVGTIRNSIVHGNLAGAGQAEDLLAEDYDEFIGAFNIDFSLVGVIALGTPSELNDSLVETDPLLGPLTHNGGPTPTHALLPGSPAIDMGDPAAVAGLNGVSETDQRGGLYTRVAGGRIDIGASESQPQHADFDADGDVDLADLLAQQRGFGTAAPNAVKADGDADDDLDVDGDDQSAALNAFGAGSAVYETLEFSEVARLAGEELPPPVQQPYFPEEEPASVASGLVNALAYDGPTVQREDAAIVDAVWEETGRGPRWEAPFVPPAIEVSDLTDALTDERPLAADGESGERGEGEAKRAWLGDRSQGLQVEGVA